MSPISGICSTLDYKIYNTPKEERYWRWLAELYDREEQFEKEHPQAYKAPVGSEWTCMNCNLLLSRPSSRQLDYVIYDHVRLFHDPSGLNSMKSKARNVRVSIVENNPGSWLLKLDNVIIQMFFGDDGHEMAQKRMKDFL